MRICFFINSNDNFNINAGGVQRITRVLADEFEKIGITSFFLSMPNTRHNITYKDNEFCLPESNLKSSQNIVFIKKLVAEKNIQIIINQYGLDISGLKFFEQINKQVRVISVHHNCISCLYEKYSEIVKNSRGAAFTNLITKLKLWPIVMLLFRLRQRLIWRKMIKVSNAVVLYFNSFEKELFNLTGIKSNKIHIIPNPAPYEYKERSGNIVNKRIIYVGRVIKLQKRIDILMQLWKKLHDEFHDWTFDLVGDGDYLALAKEYAKENNLTRVTFYGLQDSLPFWEKSDIFTLTSDFEGYGMVLIEAQARGTVPVAFNCFSAIDEVIENNQSGIILKENTVDEAFRVVKDLIENENEIIRLRRYGGQQALKFNKEIIAKKWMSLFKEICEV